MHVNDASPIINFIGKYSPSLSHITLKNTSSPFQPTPNGHPIIPRSQNHIFKLEHTFHTYHIPTFDKTKLTYVSEVTKYHRRLKPLAMNLMPFFETQLRT